MEQLISTSQTKHRITYFTDGSVDQENRKAGIGFHSPQDDTNICIRVSHIISSTQAELTAIYKALLHKFEEYKNSSILIVTDSQPAIAIIRNNDFHDNREIVQGINNIINDRKMQLPQYSGLPAILELKEMSRQTF